MQVAVPDKSGLWQALNMHMGRAKKLASAQSLSGVTAGAAGGGGAGATTAAVGALAVSATLGGRVVGSGFAGLDAALRGRSAGFGGLAASADAGAAGALLSIIVSTGSLLAASGTAGALSSTSSSG